MGGGVAALEALLAVRSLDAKLASVSLVAATPSFAYRPLAVAEPFGLGKSHRFDLTGIARDQRASLHVAGVDAVDHGRRRLVTWDGRELAYDLLLLAVGARAETAVPGSVSILGPSYTGRFRTVLRALDKRKARRIAFAVPAGASWPLPLYELALLTAAHVAERKLHKVQLDLITHESEPLDLFGAKASAAVRGLLDERGVRLHVNRVPVEARDGQLWITPGPALAADHVVSLPRLVGPAIHGLPTGADGFIPVDLHGRVPGLEGVYAAGDATTCPIKQGGVAAQQADAAAEAIAAATGVDIDPRPFRPVLRGLLLTGGQPRYLRAEVSGGRGEDWPVSEMALWWPPSKVAGHHLAPYLALHHDELQAPRGGMGVEVALDEGVARHHTAAAAGHHA
ncbi:MAG TPA: FAD/NAD(P)-binding oxidoreductase [Thermoleophilaceae bacterium]|nr:FAD/NAD(P)-binding oxidoreductase [Thermoleophilaceae bacterium]